MRFLNSGLGLPARLIIRLFTSIAAPPERVFDLTRSIDAHQQSAERTHERTVRFLNPERIRIIQPSVASPRRYAG